MSFFSWSAPLFGHFADRWDEAGIERIAGFIRPYIGECPEQCRVLDVGGGTGALAVRLHSAIGARLTVLDATPEMLRYIPSGGPVECVLGVAEDMPFEDGSFDAVIVTDAFHHFRDQHAAVREFRRVLRPGGGVLVLELDSQRFAIRAIAVIERLLGEPGAFLTPDQMCELMEGGGISGQCAPERGVSYRFVGSSPS